MPKLLGGSSYSIFNQPVKSHTVTADTNTPGSDSGPAKILEVALRQIEWRHTYLSMHFARINQGRSDSSKQIGLFKLPTRKSSDNGESNGETNVEEPPRMRIRPAVLGVRYGGNLRPGFLMHVVMCRSDGRYHDPLNSCVQTTQVEVGHQRFVRILGLGAEAGAHAYVSYVRMVIERMLSSYTIPLSPQYCQWTVRLSNRIAGTVTRDRTRSRIVSTQCSLTRDSSDSVSPYNFKARPPPTLLRLLQASNNTDDT